MSIDKKYLLWFFVMFLAGSSVGFIVGAYAAGNFGMSLALNNGLYRDALDLNQKIDILKQLRNGDNETAIESLEASIDDSLLTFDPVEPYAGLNDLTEQALDRAIRNAFDYRQDYPRRSDRPHVDRMIDNLFGKRILNPQ